ncbi:sensor histidine kinase [Runella sp. CRIBMP]|uniref:sensor histidine kinase n=1 Tax=Runella sp. CRIBMP TaxID=2683261 RepID=UPI0014126362|nr:histidine kinase [Runella sp. CRIBMP]NBB19214.1 sensor histidine kinase [Runella sp. CRIBMP]
MESPYVIIIGTGIMLIMAMFIVLFVMYYQRKQIEQQMRVKDMEAEFQRKLLEVSMASTEAERRRIAQDLHDDIGALLSVTKLTFNALYGQLGSKDQAERLAKQVREALDETISHVRRISRELVPTTLERFGLPAALQEFAAKSIGSHTVRITFGYSGDESIRMEPKVELMLYRVAQELINNALKHSGGTNVHVQLSLPPETFGLVVEDNGHGFNLQEAHTRPSPGLGLDSIEGRLRVINGKINYETGPQKGCRAVVELRQLVLFEKAKKRDVEKAQ